MGTLRFGKEDTITCIVDVPLKMEGRATCLAYKTTTHWLGGGVWVSNGGYVLKSKDVGGIYYPLPPGADEGKVEGLPHPFPTYRIPTGTYVMGYSLWWAIGVAILWAVIVRFVRRRRQAAFVATQKDTPISYGPPRLDTKGDRLVYQTAQALLVPGESIQHQAYAHSWDYTNERDGDDAFFLVLTTMRLLLISTRIGAFGILYENNGVNAIDRRAIENVFVEHGSVLHVAASGTQRGYVIKNKSALSNQTAFLQNVARLLQTPAREASFAPAMAATR